MPRLLTLVLVSISVLLGGLTANAQVQRYEKEKVRQLLFELEKNPPTTHMIVQGQPSTEQGERLIEYYSQVIEPLFENINDIVFDYRTKSLLIDSGSYNDEGEYKLFQAEFQKAAQAYNEFSVSPQVTAHLTEFARLAEGLSGEMPDLARQMAQERQLESFSESLKPKLDELERLEQEYQQALKDAPANSTLAEFITKLTEVRRRFKDGEISLEEGMRINDELYRTSGYHFIGKQAVDARGENLNRIAVLRSELAKEKGFRTWAEYKMEMNGQGYEAGYRGPANQRQFLRKYITALREVQDYLLNQRIQELGLEGKRDQLRDEHIGFLTAPSLLQIQKHYPTSQITDMWERTMVASGFSAAALSQILVDDGFREGKNRTMAYMAGLVAPYTPTQTFNAQTLSWMQTPLNSPEWKPGFSYILQSYKSDGVSGLETALHEGGHALEKALKFKYLSVTEPYGYVEVASLTMESFARDAEVLWNLAVEVNGTKPSLEEISRLVENAEKNDVFNVIFNAGQALFDLDLWDYDYSQPGARSFLTRVQELDAEIAALQGDLPSVDMPVPGWYSNVSTTHYTSGSVRYIGYVYADIGARMMTEFIRDEIEKTSGRRSWHNQPGLAPIFADQFFSVGWKSPFPGNIEAITGRSFDPEAVVRLMAERVGMP